MSSLHLVSLPLDLKDLRQWAARRDLGIDEGKVLHHLLTETFGKGALHPFRLMVVPRAGHGILYAYTKFDAAALQQTAHETGLPDALSVCDPASLATKAMPEGWNEGRRLAFDVRTRPVRRLRRTAGVFPRVLKWTRFWWRRYADFPMGRRSRAAWRGKRYTANGWSNASIPRPRLYRHGSPAWNAGPSSEAEETWKGPT